MIPKEHKLSPPRSYSQFYIYIHLGTAMNLEQSLVEVASQLIHDPERTQAVATSLFHPVSSQPLSLLVKGTHFQLKVWEALLKIPFGEMVSYQTVAEHVDNPRGLQAVGSAIGRNPVAFLIPCHRVIKKSGQISEYRWGSTRKSVMLGWEASMQHA
jgi:AraC family transcriptional regulator of adaptative response/methylated-DNA-[protein]-cysteine methyltransferase